jgi:phthalate 4,5-dioxygenase reductase subunit
MSSDVTFHQVVVAEIADEVPAVVSLKLEKANRQPMARFEPGAHIELQIPNGTRRSYSICSDPADRSHYSLGVLREPNSRGGSSYIHEMLETGDTLLMSDPKSSFRLSEDADNHVFIAGGIGVTPFLPMLRQLKESDAGFSIHYLAKDLESSCFLEDIRGFAGDRLSVYWSRTGDRFNSGSIGHIGRGKHTQVYCCGPKRLMSDVLTASTCLQRPVRFEAFEQAPARGIYAGRPFEVEIGSSGKIVPVSDTQTMLEALRQSGHDVASSCEHGICGTCLVRVLKGQPIHRDGVMTDELRKTFVAPCISRAKERLVLDL